MTEALLQPTLATDRNTEGFNKPLAAVAGQSILPRISIVTAVFNRIGTIDHAISSVHSQRYKNIDHVIIDGGSTDGTLEYLKSKKHLFSVMVSEPDAGLYDALNKGLSKATGDVVGFVHSDDWFADEHVLSEIAQRFADPSVDAVYGDLDFVDGQHREDLKVVRCWKSGAYSRRKIKWGWMPPHPTLFVRRHLVEKLGGFDTSLRIAADYDFVLRYFSGDQIKSAYIPRVLVKMRKGGTSSNESLPSVVQKLKEDYVALKKNGVRWQGALIWKRVSKIPQLFPERIKG